MQAAEKRELFGKLPLLAGLSNDLPNPGDKLLFEETGVAILIVARSWWITATRAS
jgi:hypothetical protein